MLLLAGHRVLPHRGSVSQRSSWCAGSWPLARGRCCTSRCRARCRRGAARGGGSRRPCCAPRRSMAAWLAKFWPSVRQPTSCAPSVSKAWCISSQLAGAVDRRALAAFGVPGVADLQAPDAGHDVVIAGAADHGARGGIEHGEGHAAAFFSHAPAPLRCRRARRPGSGTEVTHRLPEFAVGGRGGEARLVLQAQRFESDGAARERDRLHRHSPSAVVPLHEHELLEQGHVLLVLQQRTRPAAARRPCRPCCAAPRAGCPRPPAASASRAAPLVLGFFFRPGRLRTS